MTIRRELATWLIHRRSSLGAPLHFEVFKVAVMANAASALRSAARPRRALVLFDVERADCAALTPQLTLCDRMGRALHPNRHSTFESKARPF